MDREILKTLEHTMEFARINQKQNMEIIELLKEIIEKITFIHNALKDGSRT
jgi:acetate kinase